MLRVVAVFRLLLGVEVVEIAEEFVEAVVGRQEFVLVAEMVLAELAGHVAERLEVVRRSSGLPCGCPGPPPAGRPWTARPERQLASDERGTPGGTALLRVVGHELAAFPGKPVDVRRAVADDAAVIGADIPETDVIPHDDEDVGFLPGRLRGGGSAGEAEHERDDCCQCEHTSQRLHVIPLSDEWLIEPGGFRSRARPSAGWYPSYRSYINLGRTLAVIRSYRRDFQAMVPAVAAQDSTEFPTRGHHSTVRPDNDRGCRGKIGQMAAFCL